MPITMATIGFCSLIWFYLWNYNVSIEKFGYQYEKVVAGRQWWRSISASYAHQHPLHLIFNMASLWNSAVMEVTLGSVAYLKYTFLLVLLSMLTVTGMSYLAIRYFDRPRYRTVYSLGYSCVVFGWMMVQCEKLGGKMSYFGLMVPARLAPFLALGITQLIIPNASFIGHLSGIIVGEFIAQDFFFWFIDPVFFVVLGITCIGAGYSYMYGGSNEDESDGDGFLGFGTRTGWHRVQQDEEANENRTEMKVVNGVLVRQTAS
uniref:Peptidase S54 rhomboid domain-containing protein n=3 Tax=Lotharella globosa TaxID=91324 RepID=A0A7S3YPX7_9EUKA|mmetsp:Transcript_11789/g.23722  ORF Transcript_11789/g.23722 Transcript_11789/m.23722 type:complete len:261 (+) Transcript_11789:211-993(+)